MNLNQRELHQHVEFEPDTYYAAFSAELEIAASPMWSLISHLRNQVYFTLNFRGALMAKGGQFADIY
jgi:E3 ubiquitin-protein ligase UBR3